MHRFNKPQTNSYPKSHYDDWPVMSMHSGDYELAYYKQANIGIVNSIHDANHAIK